MIVSGGIHTENRVSFRRFLLRFGASIVCHAVELSRILFQRHQRRRDLE